MKTLKILFLVLILSSPSVLMVWAQQDTLRLDIDIRHIATEGDLLVFDLPFHVANQGSAAEINVDGLPPGAEVDPARGQFRWVPDYNQAGTFLVTFRTRKGKDPVTTTVMIQVVNSNRPPVISGQPPTVAPVGQIYFFVPQAVDPDGGNLRFFARGVPAWASFDHRIGSLSGIPTVKDTGRTADIRISVTDGIELVDLPSFFIEVVETDGADGSVVPVGDLDTDGDGVTNRRDGFPFDPTRADWIIDARTGSGGDIHPSGEVSVFYGGSRRFHVTPRAGYYIDDLLINGESVGPADSYEFVNVGAHHSIRAEFNQIPIGLSRNPLDGGLSGVERLDDGDDSHNFVEGRPRQILDYRFHTVLRAAGTIDDYRVRVVINGYSYPMSLARGVLTSGAQFSYVTRLGPAAKHRFYFVAEDPDGRVLWRYPESGDLPGPVVELMHERNLVGIAAHVNPFALSPPEAVGDSTLFRWDPLVEEGGAFAPVDMAVPVAVGEGYLLQRNTGLTLPDFRQYGEIRTESHEFSAYPGWNLIANPYSGVVDLADVQVRTGEAEPLPWLDAVVRRQVVDGLYTYQGDDWGGGYEFTAAAGANRARLIPWVGSWIYVYPATEPMSLLIMRPEK